MDEKPKIQTCAAKTKHGPCKLTAGHGTDHKGTGRCKFHGGCTTGPPKGNKNAVKYGMYRDAFLPGEKEFFDSCQLGTLDAEIRVIKIMLNRALNAQRIYLEQKEHDETAGLELTELEIYSGQMERGGPRKGSKQIRRKRDFGEEICRYTRLLASLENTRKVLSADSYDPNEKAQELKHFLDALNGSIPEEPEPQDDPDDSDE